MTKIIFDITLSFNNFLNPFTICWFIYIFYTIYSYDSFIRCFLFIKYWTFWASVLCCKLNFPLSNNKELNFHRKYLTCKPFHWWSSHQRRNQIGKFGSPGSGSGQLSAWAHGPLPRPYWEWWSHPNPSLTTLQRHGPYIYIHFLFMCKHVRQKTTVTDTECSDRMQCEF